MEKLEAIVATNLIYLRKQAGLTQLEFGEKFNYSDKTVSKWELGAVVPSVPVLKEIADFYGVTIDYIITEHKTQKEYESPITKTLNARKKITIMALAASVVFSIAVVIYVAGAVQFGASFKTNIYWKALPISLPVAFLVLYYYSRKYYKNKKLPYIFISLFTWTALIAAFFCCLDIGVFWFMFFVGIPIQAAIILLFQLRKN